MITDPKCVAETLNNYFCDVAVSDGAQMSVEEFKDHLSVRKIAEHLAPVSNFDFQLIEVEYVKGILLKLNPRKAVGCDNISQRLLRITAPAIAQPLTCLINYLIGAVGLWFGSAAMLSQYTRSRKRPTRPTIGPFHY